MLNLLGRSSVERAKSIAIGVLGGLLVVSLWQLASGNARVAGDQQNRQAVTEVARRFAIGLTTYDYAHLAFQASELVAICSPVVWKRVAAASPDLVAER